MYLRFIVQESERIVEDIVSKIRYGWMKDKSIV